MNAPCPTIARVAALAVVLLGGSALRGAESPKPLRALILSGQNNHDWRTTTPALKTMYEKSGRFTVDVTENVAALTGRDFAPYDVLVLNYTTYPKVQGHRWPAETEKALLDYIAAGHGLALFHAASTAWNDWPEFGDLIGMTWQMGPSAHGQRYSFTVNIVDHEHPVTSGMSDFQHLSDELYHRQLLHAKARVLATAYSDKTRGGSGEAEPMVVVTEFGRGRVFHVALGHDVRPMGGAAFHSLMLRGTEWAATGKVTLPAVDCVLRDADALLKDIVGYHYGQSRGPLAAVERLVGMATDASSRRVLAAKLAGLLEGNASADCKRFVCQELSLIGTAAEVPSLAKRLGDEELGFAALSALQRIPGDEALAALRGGLASTTGQRQRELMGAVAARRDGRTIPFLASAATSADRQTARAAIAALGVIGAPAAEALKVAAAHAPAELQPTCSEALLRCGQGLQAMGQNAAAAAIFESLCTAGRPDGVRLAAFVGRVAAVPTKSDERILSALSGDDRLMRCAAIRALRAGPNDRLLGELARRMDSLPADVQMQAVTLWGEHGSAAALAAVGRAATSKDEAVRRAAIAALGSIGDASTVGVLTSLPAADDEEEGKLVGESLARLPTRTADTVMIAALPTAAAAVQGELIRALVAREAKSAVPVLLAVARSSDARVYQEACRGLGKLAGGADAAAMIGLLEHAADRAPLEAALVAIFRRADSVQPLVAALDNAGGPTKASLLKVASALGGKESLGAVREALRSGDTPTRRAAMLALANWPDAAALDDLMTVAGTTDDATCKLLALRHVAQLVPMAKDRSPEQVVALLGRAAALTKDAGVLKSLMSALGQVPCAAAARLAAMFLGNSAIVDEAALAVIQIAEIGDIPQRKDVLAALKEVKATCRNPLIVARAEAVPTRPNLARGATATNPDGLAADGQAGGPQAAIDSNPKTYWDEVDNEKLYQLRVELRRPAVVSTLRISGFRQHDYAPRDFQVLCDCKVVKQVQNAQYVNNFLTVSLPPTRCTTIDLKITGYYGKSPAIRELEIYGPDE